MGGSEIRAPKAAQGKGLEALRQSVVLTTADVVQTRNDELR
jgi:hypothetical protein